MTIRTMLVGSAIWFPTVAITGVLANCAGLFAKDGFVYQYQTLLGAGVALTAAVIAVVPVWRQLDRMATQTNVALRETLSDRLRAVRGRKATLLDLLGKFQGGMASQIIVLEEEEADEVDVEWAFAQQQASETTLSRFEELREEWRDPEGIATAMDRVDATLEELRETLDAISLPERIDRYDEELDISDDEWAKTEQDALQARKDVLGISNAFDRAVEGLAEAFDAELKSLRHCLHDLDRALMRDGT